MNTQVPVGPASIVGYLLTALGTAATAWAAASGHPAISPEVLLIVTFTAGLLTNLGRQLQAKTPFSAEGPTDVVPAALAVEAETNVAKAQAQPDGVDGPAVPFAQPSKEAVQ